jgi:hypothetical protein
MKDTLTGQLVRLRAVERGDLPLIWKWQNDMGVMENLWQNPVSMARLEREFEEETSASAPVHRRFIIERLDGNAAVGVGVLADCAEAGPSA